MVYIMLPATLHASKYMWLEFCLFLKFISFLHTDFIIEAAYQKSLLGVLVVVNML
jgi:hypothetical protein